MAKEKIIIFMEGGVIQGISSTTNDIEIVTVDWDCFEDKGRTREENAEDAVSERDVDLFNGKWADTVTDGTMTKTTKAVHALLEKLDEEHPYQPEEETVFGFSREDIIQRAEESMYKIDAEDAKAILNRLNNEADFGIGVSMDTISDLIREYCVQNNIKKTDEEEEEEQ